MIHWIVTLARSNEDHIRVADANVRTREDLLQYMREHYSDLDLNGCMIERNKRQETVFGIGSYLQPAATLLGLTAIAASIYWGPGLDARNRNTCARGYEGGGGAVLKNGKWGFAPEFHESFCKKWKEADNFEPPSRLTLSQF